MAENVGAVEYTASLDISDYLRGADKLNETNNQMVDGFNKFDAQSQKTAKNFKTSTNKITKAFKLQKGAAQQVGFQLQDFAVQVAGGTSALTAFGQQGSQLAGIFGPGGALLGAVIAVGSAIGGVFLSSLFGANQELKSTEEIAQSLVSDFKNLSIEGQKAARSLLELRKTELSKELEEVTIKLGEARNELTARQITRKGFFFNTKEDVKETEEEVTKLAGTVANLELQLKDLDTSIADLGKEVGTEEYKESVDSLTKSLEAQIIALEQGEEAAFRYAAAQQLGLTAAEQLPQAIDDQINQIFYLKSVQEQQLEAERNLRKRNAEEAKLQAKNQIDLQKELGKVTDRSLDRMSNGIAKVIVEGGSLNDMFAQIGKTILTETLTALIRFGIQQLINAAIAQSASKATAASISADNAVIAASAAPAAALQSTATFGTAAVVGGTALLATLAIAKGAGRRTGGNVSAGMMHEVGEVGPELLNYGNKNYLIPGRNGSITPTDQMGSGAVSVVVNNYGEPMDIQQSQNGNVVTIDMLPQRVESIVNGNLNARGSIHRTMTNTTTAQNRGGR